MEKNNMQLSAAEVMELSDATSTDIAEEIKPKGKKTVKDKQTQVRKKKVAIRAPKIKGAIELEVAAQDSVEPILEGVTAVSAKPKRKVVVETTKTSVNKSARVNKSQVDQDAVAKVAVTSLPAEAKEEVLAVESKKIAAEQKVDSNTQVTSAAAAAANAAMGNVPADVLFSAVIDGSFDTQQQEAVETKRVLPPQPEMPKLHKVLAQAGMGSRLEMEALINEGRISVNGEPAHVGQRILYGDKIRVNGRLIKVNITPPKPRVLAYHKPVGEIVTHDDPENRPTVFRRLPRLSKGKWQSVGRLDLNTEGLLLFTNSGELANKLMHPSFGVERHYAARVLGRLTDAQKIQLLNGVKLEDGIAKFSSIEDGGGEGANCWYKVTISEGRNREVRRMFDSLGFAVSRLIRIRYGECVLPQGLKRGNWVELNDYDIQALTKAGGSVHADDYANGRYLGSKHQQITNEKKRYPNKNKFASRKNDATGFRPKRDDSVEARRGKVTSSQQPDPMKTSVGYIGESSMRSARGRNQNKNFKNTKTAAKKRFY